jgi:spore germination protein GerM
MLMAFAGCGVPIEDRAQPIAPDELPGGLRPSATSTPDSPIGQEPIDVWMVRDDRLSATRHRVDPPVTPQAALGELLSGPSEAEQNRSLRSAIPDASVVVDVTVSGGVATVDLAATFSEIPANDQVFAVGQIVLTLTDLRGIGRVRFVVDEAQIAVPLPSGDASEGSVSRDDYIILADTSL